MGAVELVDAGEAVFVVELELGVPEAVNLQLAHRVGYLRGAVLRVVVDHASVGEDLLDISVFKERYFVTVLEDLLHRALAAEEFVVVSIPFDYFVALVDDRLRLLLLRVGNPLQIELVVRK